MILRVLAVALACVCPVFSAGPADYEGKPLSAIEFVPDQQPLSHDRMLAALSLRMNEPLNLRELGAALERLYESGRFDDIVVEAEMRGDGVALIFRTTPSWFVGRVSVTGVPEPPNPGQLANATQLDLGERYVPRDVDTAVKNLVELLKSNGFYRARIFPEFEAAPQYGQVNISFAVEPGERAKFSAPVFQGDLLKSESSLIRATRWRRGWGFGGYRDLTANNLQRGLDRLRDSYRAKEYLTSKVTLENLAYDPTSNRVISTISLRAGPKIQIRSSGARLPARRLRQLVPVYQEQAVDRDLLAEGARNIEQRLEAEGYFEAGVDFEVGEVRDNAQLIRYTIDRGDRSRLIRVEFTGNKYFDEGTLRERMYLRTANLLQFRYGRVSEDILRKDREAIAELYSSNGFRDVRVTSEIVKGYRGKKDRVAARIQVEEGPQWFVSGLELSGVNLQFYEYVRSMLQSTPGQPYSNAGVAADRDVILNYYYGNGYPEATVAATVSPGAGPQRIDLGYVVREGPREFVRSVIVSGLKETRQSLADERITLRPGDPLSLNAVTETQRALSDLGIFAKVDAAIQNVDGHERNRYVLYEMEEARRYSMDFGFGAELGRIGGGGSYFYSNPSGRTGFSPRGSFNVSRLNMFGAGHTASLNTRFSNIEQRAVLSYVAPQFRGNPNWSVSSSGLYDLSKNVNTFTARREEGSLQFSQRATKATSLQYRFTFRSVDVSNLKIDPALIPLYSKPDRVAAWGGSHIFDRRDDPAEPHHGLYNTVDFSFVTSLLGPTERFTRLVWKNSTYHRVSRQVTFARSTTVGVITGIGGTKPPDIPLPERLYGGGATTLRGFPENQAGPRDQLTGFPLGGSASLFNNFELRFPLLGENVGGVLFHDMGNVYSSLTDISFRYRQPTSTIFNEAKETYDTVYGFNYTVQSAGLGIRYRTPIGPLRFDVAYSPNGPRFRGLEGTLDQILVGNGQPTVQRISHFQFFFSIGQTF